MPSSVKIRQATAHDLSEIITLLERMHEESPIAAPPIHYPKLVAVLNDAMTNFLCAVAENQDGKLIGCAAAVMTEWFFSLETYVGDIFIYVLPAHRNSNAGTKLMRTIIRYAEQQERPLVTGPTSGLDVDRKEKFYGSHGLKKMGALFASDGMFKSEAAAEDAGSPPPELEEK